MSFKKEEYKDFRVIVRCKNNSNLEECKSNLCLALRDIHHENCKLIGVKPSCPKIREGVCELAYITTFTNLIIFANEKRIKLEFHD